MNLDVKRVLNKEGWLRNAPSKDKAVGYCHHRQHKGYLSPNLIKCHKCVEKNCRYFSKYKDNIYWIRKDVLKAKKKYDKYGVGCIYIGDMLCTRIDLSYLCSVAMNHISNYGEVPIIEYRREEA